MKLRTFLILFSLTVSTISTSNAQFNIEGDLSNLPNSNYIYIYSFFGQQLSKFDSTIVDNGSFEFRFNENIPRGFYRIGTASKSSVNVVLGNESIRISGDLQDIENTLEIAGSMENELFEDFQTVNKSTFQGLSEFQKLKNDKKMSIGDFELKRDSIVELQQLFYKNLSDKNTGTFIAKVSSALLDSEKKNFWSNIDFNDDELLRGDMLVSRIFNYFRKHVTPNVESWLSEYQKLVHLTTPNSKQRELVYISLVQLFHSAAPSYAKEVAVSYHEEYPESEMSRNLLNLMPPGPPTIGELAPNISLEDSNGKIKELSSLKGNIVLIDFWASWCGPCRRENPNVVKAYHKYKDKGFTIYGVSLDQNKEKWLAAIKKDGLDWHHVSDLRGWQSKGAATYSVKGIPATFLIDKDGRIIGKNLRGKQLDDKLNEVLN